LRPGGPGIPSGTVLRADLIVAVQCAGAGVGGVSIGEVTRWLCRRSCRDFVIQRIAERLAWKDSTARGDPDEYDKCLQHYLGGPDWRDKDGDAPTAAPVAPAPLARRTGRLDLVRLLQSLFAVRTPAAHSRRPVAEFLYYCPPANRDLLARPDRMRWTARKKVSRTPV
jgi:hypothetical protein